MYEPALGESIHLRASEDVSLFDNKMGLEFTLTQSWRGHAAGDLVVVWRYQTTLYLFAAIRSGDELSLTPSAEIKSPKGSTWYFSVEADPKTDFGNAVARWNRGRVRMREGRRLRSVQ